MRLGVFDRSKVSPSISFWACIHHKDALKIERAKCLYVKNAGTCCLWSHIALKQNALIEQIWQVSCSIVVSIRACHARGPGSIPGGRASFYFWLWQGTSGIIYLYWSKASGGKTMPPSRFELLTFRLLGGRSANWAKKALGCFLIGRGHNLWVVLCNVCHVSGVTAMQATLRKRKQSKRHASPTTRIRTRDLKIAITLQSSALPTELWSVQCDSFNNAY